jgi:hypothetical protein
MMRAANGHDDQVAALDIDESLVGLGGSFIGFPLKDERSEHQDHGEDRYWNAEGGGSAHGLVPDSGIPLSFYFEFAALLFAGALLNALAAIVFFRRQRIATFAICMGVSLLCIVSGISVGITLIGVISPLGGQ